jgi:predicted porin
LIVAAAAATFVPLAHAQSSVTLYGVIDSSISYTSNVDGKKRWMLGNGAVDQSHWGLRGAEDLGGGLKAIFDVESGFDVSNGRLTNNGGLFNRQAYLGLSSGYGTVTLGRQYDAMQDYVAPLSATGSWGGTNFAHPFNNDNLSTDNGFAVNNSIKFVSADYSGFTFGGTYGFSNQAGFANNREYSVGAAYRYQGLRVAAGYAQQNNPGASGSGATDSTTLVMLNGLVGDFRQRQFGAGVSYEFGPGEVGVVWTQSRQDNFAAGAGNSTHANNYEVNAQYDVTPALRMGVAYAYTDGSLNPVQSGEKKAHYHQIGVHSNYALSKRTDVYWQTVFQHASGDEFATASIYDGGNTALSTSRNQAATSVGLRHRF